MSSSLPNHTTILDALSHHAERDPNRVAFTFLPDDGGDPAALTFSQLAVAVDTAGRVLASRVPVGERAVLLYPNGLDFIVAFLGCLAAGVIAVPSAVPRGPRSAKRTEAILHESGATQVLTLGWIREALVPFLPAGFKAESVLATDEPGEAPTGGRRPNPSSDAIAFLQYTSGSTAHPKGVAVTHANIVGNVQCAAAGYNLRPDSVAAGWIPVFHDMGLVGNVLSALFVGFHSVILAPQEFLRSPIVWLRAMSRFRATATSSPNFGYELCIQAVSDDEKAGLDLSAMETALNGAEPVRTSTLAAFSAAFACCGWRPEAFLPTYGLAETTVFASGGPPLVPPRRLTVDRASLANGVVAQTDGDTPPAKHLVSCGRTWRDTDVRIVDPDTLRSSLPNRVGEIWVRGSSVAKGYWNRPEETAETFGGHLADTGEGPFLRTGDLGFLYDDELYITGRIKDLMIIRGRNIYPQDVEALVEEGLGLTRGNTVAAFAIEDGDEEHLCVVVEADEAKMNPGLALPTFSDAIGRIREAVARDLEVTVDRVVIVKPRGVPRTTSGKVQRRLCRQRLLAGELDALFDWQAPVLAGRNAAGEEPPASVSAPSALPAVARPSRAVVAQVHGLVLAWVRAEVDPSLDRIDPDASLLALGIDSLGAVTIAFSIEEATGKAIPPDALYELSTIHEIATFVDQQPARDAKPSNGWKR